MTLGTSIRFLLVATRAPDRRMQSHSEYAYYKPSPWTSFEDLVPEERASQHCHFAFVAELFTCAPPVGGTFQFQIFIQAPSPEIWSETISGGEEILAGNGVGLFLGYLLGKNYRRRHRDHLTPPRRMDAAVCRAEMCYPFGREHGRHRQ